MKEGWSYKKLGEVIDNLRTGLNPRVHFKLNTDDATGYYITVRELKGFEFRVDAKTDRINEQAIRRINERSNLKIGDVLYSGTGTIGRTAVVNELPTWWNIKEGVYAITLNSTKLNPYYFVYATHSDSFKKRVLARTSGTTVRSIPMKELKEIPLLVPPLSEQHSIVSRLDAAFSHIDALKANAEKQLNEARKLFQAELTECMKPKEGWEEKTLGELATDMYRGSGIKREQVTKEGTPCVRYGEIYTTYNVAFDKCVSHTCEEMIPSPKYFEHGDLLFAITGESVEDIGKTIAYLGQDKCLLGGDIICMKHKQNAKYLSYALSTPDAIRQKGIGKTKLKVVHTNASALKAINVPIPPLDTQQSIVSHLDSLSSTIRKLEELQQKTLAECDALKQAMLKEVFE